MTFSIDPYRAYLNTLTGAQARMIDRTIAWSKCNSGSDNHEGLRLLPM